jgi:DNA-binding NtrC family response regulator
MTRPELKVIFTSGYATDETFRASVTAGVTHFLPKPYSLEELAQKVRRVLDAPPRTK